MQARRERAEGDDFHIKGSILSQETNEFQNRLSKNYKHLSKWARKNELGAYRIYHKDIPHYPFSIDLYKSFQDERVFVVVHQYTQFPNEEHKIQIVVDSLKSVLSLESERIIVKERRRILVRNEQYQRAEVTDAHAQFEVQEGSMRFLVKLSDYMDTGLFLDHRPLRSWLLKNSFEKKVLNLFCYTASLSCAAGKGNASQVVSVDMSNTYLEWAIHNWDLNELNPENARFLREDAARAIETLIQEKEQFDIILLDPPSFSNSKKMQGTFDVQRDHVELLRTLHKLLVPSGVMLFSNNLSDFRLDLEKVSEFYQVENSSGWSIPLDFSGTKPHQSWLLTKK